MPNHKFQGGKFQHVTHAKMHFGIHNFRWLVPLNCSSHPMFHCKIQFNSVHAYVRNVQRSQFSFSWLGVDQIHWTGSKLCQFMASLDCWPWYVLLRPTSMLAPCVRLVGWVRLSIVGAWNSCGCVGCVRILLGSLLPFFSPVDPPHCKTRPASLFSNHM